RVSPLCPFWPPGFLPERSRRLLTRAGFFSPSLDGGLPLFELFNPSWRSSSAIRDFKAAISAISSSRDGSAGESGFIESLNRTPIPMSRKIYGPDFAKPPTQPGQRPISQSDLCSLYRISAHLLAWRNRSLVATRSCRCVIALQFIAARFCAPPPYWCAVMTKVAIVGATGPTGIHLAAELRKTAGAVRVVARGMG